MLLVKQVAKAENVAVLLYQRFFQHRLHFLLKEQMAQVLRDSAQPLHKLLSEETVRDLLSQRFDYGKPWFGQLMAGPQLLAYLLQVNYWLLRYNIHLSI